MLLQPGKMNPFTKKIIIIIFLILNSALFSQEFKINFYTIPIGQGISVSDSNKIINSVGGALSQESESDLFKLSDGFLNSSQNIFSEAPLIKEFNLPEFITKDSGNVEIDVTILDLNGVKDAYLYIQSGGKEVEIIIPMIELGNNVFRVTIPDSIINIKNFRARVYAEDKLGSSSFSPFETRPIIFTNNEMTMSNDDSFYPLGVQSGSWRLISWPGIPSDLSLAEVKLSEGHVFYKYDPILEEYVIPNTIETGTGYWFKHNYKEAIIFDEDTSISIPLEDYTINIKPGWNMIGSPFSFPVGFEKDSTVGDLITYGSGDKDGWSEAQNTFYPWNGYAIFSSSFSSITLIPFKNKDQLETTEIVMDEWRLNIKLESESYFNYMTVIGRKEFAKNSSDIYDIPNPNFLDNRLKITTSLDGKGSYKYIGDFRSIEEFNGVWDLRLTTEAGGENIIISTSENLLLPQELYFSLVDVQNKSINYKILKTGSLVENNFEKSLDYKIVSGDMNYVISKSEEILDNIPDRYSLSQNYPNPFNSKTYLDYEIPKRSNVTIIIYNILGKQVKTLVNDEKNYGSYSIFWNGFDQLGNEVSTGVYFVKMITNSFVQTKKMLLLK